MYEHTDPQLCTPRHFVLLIVIDFCFHLLIQPVERLEHNAGYLGTTGSLIS